jgi:hypothetical protein
MIALGTDQKALLVVLAKRDMLPAVDFAENGGYSE